MKIKVTENAWLKSNTMLLAVKLTVRINVVFFSNKLNAGFDWFPPHST